MVTFVRPDARRWDVPETIPERRPEKPAEDQWEREREKRARVREAAARLLVERGPGGATKRAVLDAAGVHHSEAARLVGSVEALLQEILAEFLHGLGIAVGGAFDRSGERGPLGRLEAVVAAWVEHAARHRAAYRLLTTGLTGLGPADRAHIASKLDSVLEMVGEALRAVMGLDALPEGLDRAMRRLLLDGWADESGPEERTAMARRIAGMLACGVVAEATGLWPGLGPIEGSVRQEVVESAVVRLRFGEVLAFAASGGEVLVRRYGRVVAKVVAANVVQDSGFGG